MARNDSSPGGRELNIYKYVRGTTAHQHSYLSPPALRFGQPAT